MTALANNYNIWENKSEARNSQWELWSVKKYSSRKVNELLAQWPQTVNYINKSDILIADDDMISIFWKTADKRNWAVIRWTTEFRNLETIQKQIEEWLNDDLKKCEKVSIHHIEMSVESFKCLYIEWVITQKMLEESQVAPWIIIIKNVWFSTEKWEIHLPIFVSPNYSFEFATVNTKWITI